MPLDYLSMTPLTRRSYRILESFATIALTPKALDAFSLEEIDFREKIAYLLQKSAPQVRLLFRVALWTFELFPLFFRFRTFSRLDAARQDRFFKKWHGSRSYLLYLPMKILLTFVYTAYYSHPKVSASLGFEESGAAPKGPLRGSQEAERPESVIASPPQADEAIQMGPRDVSGIATSPLYKQSTPRDDRPRGILSVPQTSKELEVEVCVIGSGAGGAVVAKELAEKGHEVLILEEGGYFSRDDFRHLSTLERNRLMYRDSGLFTTLGLPMILLPTGQCVGGTTLINSGTCFRTPDKVLQKWQKESGLTGLTAASMISYFEKVEKTLRLETVPDGVFGPNDRLVGSGAERLGFHHAPLVRNAPGCRGSGVCIFGCPTGAKQSMEQSYLPLAFKAGAKLYPHCHVGRLVPQGDRVYKIEAVFTDGRNGGVRSRLTVYPKKVVVACGTIFTPLLLKRSRIALTSRALGKNLTVHPTAKIIGLFDDVVDGFRGVPQASSITDFGEEGIMFESVFFPPWLLATSIYHAQEEHYEIMRAYRNLGIFGFLIQDQSRGSVHEGLAGRPLVLYSLGEREKELFVKGLKILGRVFFAAGAKKIYPTIWTIPSFDSVNRLEQLDSAQIRRTDFESAAFHPLGTCRMGTDPRDSVIDETMRVHGTENLWIADGSIFPTSLGVNPQITIMAFAARCADLIDRQASPL